MAYADKIKTLEELAQLVAKAKATGNKVVLCHGVFDLLHIGHIRYFGQAKAMGDILVVTLTSDRHVDKGPGRPVFSETLRAEGLASLNDVDFVAINAWDTAEETLRLLRPDIYVKGEEFRNIASDMTGRMGKEGAVVKELGIRLEFAGDIVFSSSNLINRYLSNLPKEIQTYLQLFKTRYTMDEVLAALDKMQELRVLVVGDTILDEYQYCNAIGKSSKDPVLAVSYQTKDMFAGGALAVANHVANFAGSVGLLTTLGDHERYEDFIRANLNPAINAKFLTKPNSPTTIKRRIVDSYSFTKLIEIYVMNSEPATPALEEEACAYLLSVLRDYDLVIAADFGHSAISPRMINMLMEFSPYLAVNVQANAGNRSFNTLSKYPRADFISLAEHEIRLETRDLLSDVRSLMTPLAVRTGSRHFIVTLGRSGCAVTTRGRTFVKIPSFASNVVDRVGAGDALLSVGALASRLDLPDEIIGFIGNVVGGLAVECIGNQRSIDPLSAKKYIKALLK
jgi:rfaE bifunctional protein nucleotidyltransferase chain/domain